MKQPRPAGLDKSEIAQNLLQIQIEPPFEIIGS